MVMSTITFLLNRQTVKSAGTLQHALPLCYILLLKIHYRKFAWSLKLNAAVSNYQNITINDLLTESSKTDKEWLHDNQKFDLTINKHYNW